MMSNGSECEHTEIHGHCIKSNKIKFYLVTHNLQYVHFVKSERLSKTHMTL